MKILKLFIALTLAGLSAGAVNAQTQTWQIGTPNPADVIATLNFADSTMTISGTGAMTDYSGSNTPWYYQSTYIKTLVMEEGTTSIGNYAFYYCSGLTSVTISNSVTSIGDAAFYSCSGLTSVTIGNSVKTIGNFAFTGCSGLTVINATSNNPYYSSDNGVLFNKNQTAIVLYPTGKLGAYTIPNSVDTVRANAFSGCSGITSVTIQSSVITIGNSAFSYCSGLTSITIPNSVTKIGNVAFQNCTGLITVTIGNSVTSIGYSAFQNCTGLTSVNFNATNCTSMGTLIVGGTTYLYPVFYNCPNLTTLNIGNNVQTIPDNAFFGCSGLTSVTIPNSVTSIGNNAFSECSGLTSVTIGNSVTSIGYAFQNCTGLTSVNFNATNCTAIANSGFFYNCPNLTTLNIGNNVQTISAYAFYYCRSLTSVTIGNLVTSIGDFAFSDCSGLTSVTIPNSVTTIGNYAFYDCSSLTSIYVLSKTPSIVGYSAFRNVSASIPVYIPCGSINLYQNSAWNYFTNFVINGIVSPVTNYNATICYGSQYTDQNFTNLTSTGKYDITLMNINACDSVVSLNLTVIAPPVQQNICMVSVDNSNHNQVVWQKNEVVNSYNIYRESNVGGQYDLLANVPYGSPNTFTDAASNAKIRSYSYKVAAIDTCGNESALSAAHKTMHLTINAGQNNSWNLIWTPYEGVSFSTYNIYRAKGNNGTFELIGTMPAGNTSYSDFSPGSGNVYYMVEIVLGNPCNVATQSAPSYLRNVTDETVTSIHSNIATNAPSAIDDVFADNIKIYPNPVKDELRIKNDELRIKNVEIVDLSGRAVLMGEFNSPLQNGNPVGAYCIRPNETIINVSSLPSGIYFVKISTDTGILTRKFVKE